MLSSLGNGEPPFALKQKLTDFPHCILGSGVTTSLISLIANAGQADQAIATAGNPFPCLLIALFLDVQSN